jgi:hypothetical protein
MTNSDTHITQKTPYRSIEEVPEEMQTAYDLGHYVFAPPPVCTSGWDTLAWINWVHFTDPNIEHLRDTDA